VPGLFAADDIAGPAWRDALGLLSIPVLVFLNGFFVAAEFALVAVRKTRVEELVTQGVSRARAVQEAIVNLDRSIAATQLGITLASLALGWLGETALEHLIHPLFVDLPEPWNVLASHSVATGIAFFLITFLHVVFGELIPKTLALASPDTVSLWVAAPLMLFTNLTRPLILLMNGTGVLILRLCGHRGPVGEAGIHSVEELALLIEDTEEAGILDSEQADLVQNVFRMTEKTVGDCMVSREKMNTLEINSSEKDILNAVREGAHTRMPVYEKDLDNILGIVNTKDLFHLFSQKGLIILWDAIYPPIYLKPDESLANALRLFKKSHKPMALVRDEQDKILGLITLEDVLEEIIGDIEDEHDSPGRKKVVRWRRRELAPPKSAKQ
jgi:putative hemolysin